MPSAPEIYPLLSEIDLTRDLSESTRQDLAQRCRWLELPAKQRLFADTTRGDHLFLVDGHIAALVDGATVQLEGHQGLTEPSLLFEDAPPDAVAATLTPCILFSMPVAALETARAERLEVGAIELDNTESALLAQLYELIANKRLELPARPEVALKIQQLTLNTDSGLDGLTEVIQSDGTIAGALLHATNSPLFRAAEPILSVRDAVVRLGFRNTRMLTTGLALRQSFKARHQVTQEAMKAFWTDAVACSAYCYLLSDTLGILHRERALLAGLVAGIGVVPVIQFLEMRDPDPQRDTVDTVIEHLRGITGMLVINYWGLGEDLVAVAEHAHDWSYATEAPDYASLVILARWSVLQSEGRPHPEPATVPAFGVLGVPIPPSGEGIAALASQQQELQSLKNMFDC